MAECDANYLRLLKLMPDLADSDRRSFNVILGESEPRVHFEVTERCKYTTVVNVTLELGGLPETRIAVRIYHDAKSAEVIAYQDERGFDAVYDYPNTKMRQRDEKAQVNRFLSEFLAVCLEHGVCSEEPITVN